MATHFPATRPLPAGAVEAPLAHGAGRIQQLHAAPCGDRPQPGLHPGICRQRDAGIKAIQVAPDGALFRAELVGVRHVDDHKAAAVRGDVLGEARQLALGFGRGVTLFLRPDLHRADGGPESGLHHALQLVVQAG